MQAPMVLASFKQGITTVSDNIYAFFKGLNVIISNVAYMQAGRAAGH
jgi:hypothetical protein